MACHSSRPPPIVPRVLCRSTSMQAPASRGAEPRSDATITRTTARWRVRLALAASTQWARKGPMRSACGASTALMRPASRRR
jgi:hypothetical protein